MDYQVKTKVRVRFADVDSMGHANNAKYFTYFEQARVAYFQKIESLDFRKQEGAPEQSVILAKIECSFLSPAFLDEELEVKLAITKLKRSSFVIQYEVEEVKTGRKVATGESVQVYFNYKEGKSCDIPTELRQKFEEIEGRSLSS